VARFAPRLASLSARREVNSSARGKGNALLRAPDSRVRIVLVRPETAVNVGASARALRNAGLEGLDLVAPGDWRTVECWRTAWGAHDVLEQARVFDDLPPALAEAEYVAALSGREPGEAIDVRDMAAEVAGLGRSARVALVFGPETTGLSDGEMALCGRRVVIPAHAAQPSLNLSHAVMIAGYEVLRAGGRPRAAARRATYAEKEAMLARLREGLEAARALPRVRPDSAFAEWRRLFQRADLTPKEVRLIEHMSRRMMRRC
jgi:tRNA/rRNA methyltransferase